MKHPKFPHPVLCLLLALLTACASPSPEALRAGSSAFGAWTDGQLAGFAILDRERFGSRAQYVGLAELHVSQPSGARASGGRCSAWPAGRPAPWGRKGSTSPPTPPGRPSPPIGPSAVWRRRRSTGPWPKRNPATCSWSTSWRTEAREILAERYKAAAGQTSGSSLCV